VSWRRFKIAAGLLLALLLSLLGPLFALAR
jgi:hypothetical protein